MSIPDFQTLMRPLLEFASDGKQHSLREARESLADRFKLTDEEKKALLPSGRQAVLVNRVAWAKVYLQHAGLLESPQRGHFKISDRGRNALQDAPERITIRYLERFPGFVEFRSTSKSQKVTPIEAIADEEGRTPEETLEAAHLRLRTDLASELLSRVKKCSPQFFERLVVELLLKMGYGGSREEAGEAVGSAGDEGIDGVINEDRLGLDSIYLQAKRWDGTVGRPEIQKFVGALHGKKAKKGVFITTGAFSADGAEYVRNIESKVVLINGRQLAEFMIDFNVGVDSVISYDVKRITSDYFEEE
ncbi:MAG TPA: restriction endonuclease [Candidatus Acidoferrum sp.]|jgi:restriction system protein|nr:restriction endonuclease [Candidatus Acidoferrum sp.]